jgi:hypothetical protein
VHTVQLARLTRLIKPHFEIESLQGMFFLVRFYFWILNHVYHGATTAYPLCFSSLKDIHNSPPTFIPQ